MKQWSIAKLNKEQASAIATNYGLSPIISTLLSIRNITTYEEIDDFLNNESSLFDPFDLKDMDKAVKRIKTALENNEKICIYGDYDADGVTSTTLLYSYFETAGADVMYYIPSRHNEGYGMNMNAVDILHKKNVNLIITVDNGISAVDEIKYAKSLGIDTVVTDHHMPSEELPQAVAVVDAHQSDCQSKFKLMSGVGIAFKLIMALEGEYCDVDVLLDNYADIVSIGTIGDIVPLISENRVFVKRGIKNLSNCDRVGLTALINESGLANKEINSGKISFTIVPRINAVGRLGVSKDSVSLLLTDDNSYAQEMAEKLGQDNSQRQNIEKEILESINRYIAENPSVVQDRVIILSGENWHQGVVGIVSSKVKETYGKPCIVLSENNDKSKGSGRSIEGFDLWQAINECSDLLTQYGGHPMAVGLSLETSKIDEFRKAINEYAKSVEMPFDKLKIDCKLNSAYLDVDIAKELQYLQPYGAGNPTPVFQLSKMRIVNITSIGGDKHLRLFLASGTSRVNALYFSCSSAQFPYVVGDDIDLAVTLEVNNYKGNESLSVIVKDIKFADVDNTEYLKSLRLFERFCKGERLTLQELLSIIPTRTDFATVYRFIRQYKANCFPPNVLVHRLGGKISYGKIKVIFEAMNDLGLVAIYEDMKKFEYKILDVSEKVELSNSTIIKKLKEAYQNEQV